MGSVPVRLALGFLQRPSPTTTKASVMLGERLIENYLLFGEGVAAGVGLRKA